MNLLNTAIALRANDLKNSPLHLNEVKAMEQGIQQKIEKKKNRRFFSLLFGKA